MKQKQIELLIKIKNVALLGREKLSCVYDKKNLSIVEFLYKEGLLRTFFIEGREILIHLNVYDNRSPLKKIKIISKPSYKKYLSYRDISRIETRKSIVAVSTSKGVYNLTDCKKKKLGGKILYIC
jgi:ribosomal protein S8